MLNLESVSWKEFKLKDIFTLENCKCSNVSKLSEGKFPYVGATNRNNGVLKFVRQDQRLVTSGNCIVFICDGEGSVGYSIYKEEGFIGSTTLKVGRNANLNRYVGLFITTIADKVRNKYNFGFKRNEQHLKNEILFLPIDSCENPDWFFMESYMKGIERRFIQEYHKHIGDISCSVAKVVSLDKKDWKEFVIGELFDLEQGKSKGLNHLEQAEAGYNYLGATNQNNGVLCQVKPVAEFIQQGNCIAFIRNGEGSMGYSMYKSEDFIATSDISVGYNPNLNRYIGAFITTIADRVRGKYNFGYKRSGSRLAKEKLMLPIDSDGNPDYAYMEHYMKNIESSQLQRYLDYLNNK